MNQTNPINSHDVAPVTQPATGNALHTGRRKSWGEHLFNFTTYAGVTWILNEALSTIFGHAIDPASPGQAKAGRWSESFSRAVDSAHSKSNPLKLSRETYHTTLRTLWLTIGGNLLVPLVKYLEDNKGSLVRHADATLERGKYDPQLEKAHQEMDNAPKQTWSSLIRGRLLVMAGAVGLTLVSGNENSPTTRWLEKTPFRRYSNMERFGTSAARDMVGAKWSPLRWLERDPAKRTAIETARSLTTFAPLDATREGKAVGLLGGTFGFVLVLSGVLSAMFYVSSKFFAARQNAKEQRQETIHKLEHQGLLAPAPKLLDAAEKIPELADQPSTSVNAIIRDASRVAQLDRQVAPA